MRSRALRQAASRPYDLHLNQLSDAAWDRLTTAPCVFCGSSQANNRDLRNIAVIDRRSPLNDDNVAPCCPLCWATRAGQSVKELRDRAQRITAYVGSSKRTLEYRRLMAAQPPLTSARFSRDMRRRDKHRCRHAPNTDYALLAAQIARFPCWYCGDPSTGADRIDSSICPGYMAGNVVPCCSLCNSMKHVLPRGTFLRHMQHLADVVDDATASTPGQASAASAPPAASRVGDRDADDAHRAEDP